MWQSQVARLTQAYCSYFFRELRLKFAINYVVTLSWPWKPLIISLHCNKILFLLGWQALLLLWDVCSWVKKVQTVIILNKFACFVCVCSICFIIKTDQVIFYPIALSYYLILVCSLEFYPTSPMHKLFSVVY